MNKNSNCKKTQQEKEIKILVTYGDKPLIDCMKKIISKRIL